MKNTFKNAKNGNFVNVDYICLNRRLEALVNRLGASVPSRDNDEKLLPNLTLPG